MDNYDKGDVVELEDKIPLSFASNAVHMKVNYGSKIRNLMNYAVKAFENSEVRQLTWTGSGEAVAKTVSCAEIMKKGHKNLYQITNIRYRRVEEHWVPKDSNLEKLRVNRDIPAITVLLSKDPLDPSAPGYQGPGLTIESSASSSDKKHKFPKAKSKTPKLRQNEQSNTDVNSTPGKKRKLKRKSTDTPPSGSSVTDANANTENVHQT